jgi:hypothetical protein
VPRTPGGCTTLAGLPITGRTSHDQHRVDSDNAPAAGAGFEFGFDEAQHAAVNDRRQFGDSVKIGQAADLAEVSIDTVRFYERRGVLPTPERAPSGYRTYTSATVDRIRLARRLQQLGSPSTKSSTRSTPPTTATPPASPSVGGSKLSSTASTPRSPSSKPPADTSGT